MSYYERQTRAAANATANAADDESSAKQKDKSDYISELADHLDVDTNALKAALSDASEAVVKALVVELGPGAGEPQDGPSANARIPDEYPDGTIDGKRRDVVDVATARERVQTLVANSAGTGSSSSDLEGKTFGEMTEEELHQALDELEDKLLTEEDVAEILNGEQSPSANAGDGGGVDASDYPDGTVGADAGFGSSEPTGNASTEQRDTGSDDVGDYSDGTIGGDL